MLQYPKITNKILFDLLSNRFKEDGFLSLKDLPHPSLLKDMDRATTRIIEAIKNKEKIILIGDYDVDGVVSTTVIKLFFDEIGVDLEWIIPNRFRDGYGLSPTLIPRIEGFDLVITVDNGISAVEAANICHDMGIDLIITDHHLLPPLLPKAYAIVDQKQDDCSFPYDDICGAQIAWYLIASLKNALNVKIDIKSYLDLVSIAIIADMMPLKHINRTMVLVGIELLNQSDRAAVKAFKEYLDRESFTSDDIGFQLAPTLNSAGRMDDALYAVQFLLSPNIYEARVALERLVNYNNSRKEIEQDITEQALALVNEKDDVLVLSGQSWHEGVLGIVAARVSRHCSKPTIILTESREGELKGSGRSFGECDLFAITNTCREYLNKFGGHQAAIGLSLYAHNLEIFRESLQVEYNNQQYSTLSYDPEIVGELSFLDITFDLTKLMQQFEPYGQTNIRPKFISQYVTILQVDTMGKNGEHLRFAFEQAGVIMTGVKFKTTEKFLGGERVSLSYRVNENNFRGKCTLQLLIDDIMIHDN